jgi:hypothetical protein
MNSFEQRITRDGIVVTDFGRFPELTLPLVEQALAQRLATVDGPRPVLLRVHGAFSATAELHRWGASESYSTHTKALALVGEYAVCAVLLDVFSKLEKPPFPCRFFRDEDAALRWLRDTA